MFRKYTNPDDFVKRSEKGIVILGVSGTIITLCLISVVVVLSSFSLLVLSILFPVICIPIIIAIWLKKYLMIYKIFIDRESVMKRLGQKKISYLENIIQNSNDIIFTLDSDLFILKFNKGAEFHFKYSQEEILGKPVSTLFTNKTKILTMTRKALKSGNFINEEISMKTKQGKVRLLYLSISQMNYKNININGFVVTAKDITDKKILEKELRKKNEQLSLLAITDSLTKLFNVRHFYDQIKRELKRLSRNPDRRLSLILIDIDRFKNLNDTEGHQMGDHVLRSLAKVINVCIREDIDSGFRYGGDEFVIMLPDTDKEQADVVAKRIQKQFGAFKFGQTSLSIGITEALVGDDERTIVKRTDDAMYRAKRSGKGCVTIS